MPEIFLPSDFQSIRFGVKKYAEVKMDEVNLKIEIAETLLAVFNVEATAESLIQEESLFGGGKFGFDSVDMVSAIIAVEKKYGVAFPDHLDFGTAFRSISAIQKTVLEARSSSKENAPIS
jgi:acyl carrier protein